MRLMESKIPLKDAETATILRKKQLSEQQLEPASKEMRSPVSLHSRFFRLSPTFWLIKCAQHSEIRTVGLQTLESPSTSRTST